MATTDDEEELLRSVAMQNAQSILLAPALPKRRCGSSRSGCGSRSPASATP